MRTLRPPRRASSVKPAAKKDHTTYNINPSQSNSKSPHPVRKINIDAPFELNYLDVSHQKLTDFSFLLAPDNTPTSPSARSIRTVDATFNNFVDFSLFPSNDKFPNFRMMDLDVSDCHNLSSFKGCGEVQRFQGFRCYRSPISENPYFRICALLAFGQSLKTINGDPVKASERQAAHENIRCSEIIRMGWMPSLNNLPNNQSNNQNPNNENLNNNEFSLNNNNNNNSNDLLKEESSENLYHNQSKQIPAFPKNDEIVSLIKQEILAKEASSNSNSNSHDGNGSPKSPVKPGIRRRQRVSATKAAAAAAAALAANTITISSPEMIKNQPKEEIIDDEEPASS